MKKTVRLILGMAILGIALMSCEKDNNSDNNSNNNVSGEGLTITGMPSEVSEYNVEIYAAGTTLELGTDRLNAYDEMLAHGNVPPTADKATFILFKGSKSTAPWTGSGQNLKVILSMPIPDTDFTDYKIAINLNANNGTGILSYSDFNFFNNVNFIYDDDYIKNHLGDTYKIEYEQKETLNQSAFRTNTIIKNENGLYVKYFWNLTSRSEELWYIKVQDGYNLYIRENNNKIDFLMKVSEDFLNSDIKTYLSPLKMHSSYKAKEMYYYGDEKVIGKECAVYVPNYAESFKFWVDKETGLGFKFTKTLEDEYAEIVCTKFETSNVIIPAYN